MRFPPRTILSIIAPIGGWFAVAVLLPGFGRAQDAVAVAPGGWDVFSDTWVATDGLGRSLPTHAEVGSPRADKTVGIFYFLWLGQHGNRGPFDVSKILARDPTAGEHPESPLWGPLGAPHHWGESIFGYYVSDDESVLRKHAQMLADAGVDVVVFDVTNQLTYPRSRQALCRVFDAARREGNRVPRIVFLCPFGSPRHVVRELWEQLYGPGLYPELWFRWEGKPLILADPALLGETILQDRQGVPTELRPGHTLGQTFTVDRSLVAAGGSFPTWATKDSDATLALYRDGPGGPLLGRRRSENLVDNAWWMVELDSAQPPGTYYLELSQPRGKVGWWSCPEDALAGGQALADGAAVAGDRKLRVLLQDERDEEIRRFFTFRKPQPDYFAGPTGPEQWGWLEVYPQHAFYKTPGVAEEVTVGIGQNVVDGRLGVLSHPRSHGRSFHDGRQPGPEGVDTRGRNFAEQWRRALKIDPRFIFITGWNEWIAGRYDQSFPLEGAGPVTFVDEFNQEYSRDIEPMRGGHGDNYYYQMVAAIRRYKGARPLAPVETRPIVIDGRFDDWRKVAPEYRDTIGDPVQRDHPGWDRQRHYVNHTGRNDLVAAKVSCDRRQVYFYLRSRRPRLPQHDPAGTLLLIDSDSNPATGWLGYDLIVNRAGGDDGWVLLERNVEGRYEWDSPLRVACRATGNELELAIPWAALGRQGPPLTIDFKWADNIRQTGQWSDFTLNGDVAPNDRFNYRARLPAATPAQKASGKGPPG